ncbi:hypothetical protein [Candidatus Mycoplasma haematominutum]|uniref:Uncharacterized protein n=1 Tax=Candidatus Mycoplasma haematominutum 'Birmingham 1' TaxID=1116213 RepID=G8C406_9MOLU|nr:hypothetical protein [Candidatus Mycoplasma haematominutum]CCE67054.1 conserved haemoplasma hypothetical protein [Candidatus Mycoplasma haematominutum 'Birmingham 1']
MPALLKLGTLWIFIREYLYKWQERIFPNIYSPGELRILAAIYSISNIVGATFFYCWHLNWIQPPIGGFLLLISAICHLLIGARFLRNSQKFGRIAFTKWSWLNLIFVSPLGLILLYYVINSKYWILEDVGDDPVEIRQRITDEQKRRKMTVKQRQLQARFNAAVIHLRKINSDIANRILLEVLNISNQSFEELDFFRVSVVIALSAMLKQNKQKTFNNLIWGAHWYEDNFFTFGIKNPKPISMYNKYPLLLGAVVLDELNNYKKILNAKMLIKDHLSFSDAKVISLHMGSEYKLFINQ